MRVFIGLIILPTYFCHSLLQVEYNCALIKVDWLSFSSGYGVQFAQHPDNGKQGPIPEEMPQTLLINKKQGIMDEVLAANIIKPT